MAEVVTGEPVWAQATVRLTAKARGCHLVTDEVVRGLGRSLGEFRVGTAHVFLPHTSAALCLNENTDPDVQLDLADILDRVVPEGARYRHADEGKDDMPAHGKCALVGASLSVPVRDGRLLLGTWQGIYLVEPRDHARPRSVVVTLSGMRRKAK